MSIWSWNMTDDELNNQVDNYSTLSFTSTARGAAILLGAILLGLTLVLGLFDIVPLDSSTITELIIYAVALFFISKGHRWAIVLVMLLWTADKAVQVYNIVNLEEGNVTSIVIWWLIFMPYLIKALKVENARKKIISTKPLDTNSFFCNHCGMKQENDAKFCVKCGNKLAAN